jgi:hypothetical protein
LVADGHTYAAQQNNKTNGKKQGLVSWAENHLTNKAKNPRLCVVLQIGSP